MTSGWGLKRRFAIVSSFARAVRTSPLVVLALATGCGWEMKPKGFGASGEKKLDVLADADLGLAVVNNIDAKQQTRFDALHRPWEKVTIEASKLDEAQKKTVVAVKDQWAKVPFGDVVRGDRYFYRAVIKTNVDTIDLLFFETGLPDHARNFMARAKAGAFKGQVVTPVDGILLFGPPTGKEAYTMKNRVMPVPLPEFTLLQMPADDGVRVSGERFGLNMVRQPRLSGKAMMVARISNVKPYLVLEKLANAHNEKPGSVIIQDVVVDPPVRNGLYLNDGGVQLPELDANGDPIDSSIAMFLGARGAMQGGSPDTPAPKAPEGKAPPGSGPTNGPPHGTADPKSGGKPPESKSAAKPAEAPKK
jgi:hypothetical protein